MTLKDMSPRLKVSDVLPGKYESQSVRVGCFERTACILSIVKQITSPGGRKETRARAWCTGKGDQDGEYM